MTTPVFTDTAGDMAFVIGGAAGQVSGALVDVPLGPWNQACLCA